MNQQVVYQDISQIHPYENNPRNNEAAIEPVAQSIKRFGFRVPIISSGIVILRTLLFYRCQNKSI